MAIKPSTHTKLHNEGQADAAKGYGNFDIPHGKINEVLSEDCAQENKAYKEGYAHGVKQRD